MALATLNGAKVGQGPPHFMDLSHTTMAREKTPPSVYPIMIPCTPNLPAGPLGRLRRFHEFRTFGPLYLVKTDVDLGFPERGDLLCFSDVASAQAAVKHLDTMVKGPWMRIVNQRRLRCTVCTHYIHLRLILNDCRPCCLSAGFRSRCGYSAFHQNRYFCLSVCLRHCRSC
jgi:hypothetical protein